MASGNTPEKRKYPIPDMKLLYSRAMGSCCFPACENECVEEDLSTGAISNSGQIAHIEGVGEGSNRHNAKLSLEARDSYPNWILLCGRHHPRIDVDSKKVEKTYSVTTIKAWKAEKESRLRSQTQSAMPEVSSTELEIVTKHLLKDPSNSNESYTLLAVTDKIKKNKLSDYVASLLEIGIAKAPEVAYFVNQMEVLSTGFSECLRTGFITNYQNLWSKSYREDALFQAMFDYASQNSKDSRRQAAGLAVLAYYFELCEVFEK